MKIYDIKKDQIIERLCFTVNVTFTLKGGQY